MTDTVYVCDMTLRDEFAKEAMQALMYPSMEVSWVKDRIASRAYQMADAMLKAREVPNDR